WMHRIDEDILLGILDGGGLSKEPDGPFGGVVRRGGGTPHQAIDGRDVNDRPTSRLTHLGNGVLRAQKYPFGVHVHLRVHTATVVSSTVNRAPVPALLTRTFSLPKVAMVVCMTSCHSSSLVTSCRTNKASPPLARI